MGLLIVDHLHPVLDGAQCAVGGGKGGRDGGIEMPGGGERGERGHGRGDLQREVAAAMDELLDLSEEFNLANAAAAALEVIAGAECLALFVMIADAQRDLANLVDRTEVERAAPDERADLGEEAAAECEVAGAGASADESGALPGQRRTFVMSDGGIDGQYDRGNFGRRPEAKVDPLDIAIGGTRLDQLDHPLADAHRRLARFVALAAGEGRRGRKSG